MARYTEVVRQVLAAAAAGGRVDFPVGELVMAHAVDVLDPNTLSAKGDKFSSRGRSIAGPADVRAVLNVPGVRVFGLMLTGQAGVVSTISAPSNVLADFSAASIADQLGYDNVRFLEGLKKLYIERVAPLGLLPVADVARLVALCDAGVAVLPTAASHLASLGYPSALQVPALDANGMEAWGKVCAAFKEAMQAYATKNLATAAALVESAAMWAALADITYSAVEAVRDLPANAAGVVLDAAAGTFLRPQLIALGVLALAGVWVWFNREAIVRRAAAATKLAG